MFRVRRLAIVSSIAALVACHPKPVAPIGTSIETATFDSTLHVDLKASTRMPSGMYYRDLVAGNGPAVASGQQLSVTYIGWLTNGEKFDAGSYAFRLGAGSVIPGWDQGLVGMRVGGTRQLIIPSALAYGDAGQGKIPPHAVLVFNVDLTEAH
ncbi:MAG: FKBP-type peptidyl-prolyl cis-trans isomerase [Gemmatimonadales bacterium]